MENKKNELAQAGSSASTGRPPRSPPPHSSASSSAFAAALARRRALLASASTCRRARSLGPPRPRLPRRSPEPPRPHCRTRRSCRRARSLGPPRPRLPRCSPEPPRTRLLEFAGVKLLAATPTSSKILSHPHKTKLTRRPWNTISFPFALRICYQFFFLNLISLYGITNSFNTGSITSDMHTMPILNECHPKRRHAARRAPVHSEHQTPTANRVAIRLQPTNKLNNLSTSKHKYYSTNLLLKLVPCTTYIGADQSWRRALET
jgi:hypothetical protein